MYFRLVTYAILFGFKPHPFFEKTLLPVGADKGTPKHKTKEAMREIYHHNCTTSPEAVRDEVLERDFTPTFMNNAAKVLTTCLSNGQKLILSRTSL